MSKRTIAARALELIYLVDSKVFEDLYPFDALRRDPSAACRAPGTLARPSNAAEISPSAPSRTLRAIIQPGPSEDLFGTADGDRFTHLDLGAFFSQTCRGLLSAGLAVVVEVIDIDLPRPRDLAIRETPEFGRYASEAPPRVRKPRRPAGMPKLPPPTESRGSNQCLDDVCIAAAVQSSSREKSRSRVRILIVVLPVSSSPTTWSRTPDFRPELLENEC